MRRLSYQSKGSVVALFAALLIGQTNLSAYAKPYEDTQGRFSVSIPENWSLAPQFGDTSGTRFRRTLRRDADVVWFSIKVLKSERISLFKTAQAYERRSIKTRGWRARAGFKKAKVGRLPALTRSYRRSKPDPNTQALALRTYAMQTAAAVFLFELAIPRPSLAARLARDLDHFLTSFRPRDFSASPPKLVRRKDLLGLWTNDSDGQIQFGEDGRFLLRKGQEVKKRGRFRLESNRLVLSTTKDLVFEVTLDAQSGRLQLRSTQRATVIEYKRKKQTNRQSALVGHWQNTVKDQDFGLKFRADQTFEFGPLRGRWSAVDTHLRLTDGQGTEIEYEFELSEGFVLIHGGDLSSPQNFRKIPGS